MLVYVCVYVYSPTEVKMNDSNRGGVNGVTC